MANTGGKVVGYGFGKVANVVAGFTSGFETGMKAGQQLKQGEQQTQEAPQTIVTEEEKIEKKGIG